MIYDDKMEKNDSTGARRTTLITLVVLLVGVFLVGFVSAEKIEYTPTSTTVCDDFGVCTATLYSGVQNVLEDDKWINIEQAVSLMDSGAYKVVVLEDDIDYPLEILDYNMTSITLDLKHWSIFNDEIDLRIWKYNESKEQQYYKDVRECKKENKGLEKSYRERYNKIKHEKEVFNIFDLGGKKVTYSISPGDIIEFGPNSTTVTLQIADTENLDDGYITEYDPTYNGGSSEYCKVGGHSSHISAMMKFNISSLTYVDTISSANISLYAGTNLFDAGEYTYVRNHHIYENYDWTEDVMTWNNRPSSGSEYNNTYEDSVYFDDNDVGYNIWDINEMLTTELDSNSIQNLSIYFISTLGTASGNGDYIRFASKEDPDTAQRPKISVTYSTFNAPSIVISYPINGTTYDVEVNHFNWSITNYTSLDTCEYSLDGATNVSVTCGDNYQPITLTGGMHTIIFTFNDTYSRYSASVNFNQSFIYPTATITYPINGTIYGTKINHFNWTITNSSTINTCLYSINGTSNVSVTCTDLYKAISVDDGNYNILFTLNDSLGQINWTQNFFTQDTTGPVINVTYPYETITNQTIPHTLYFNWTAVDATNETSSCWFNYNNTNTTVTCGDLNTTFVTNIAGQRNITFYANDSLNNVANFTRYWDYKFLERSRTFNTTSYETTTDAYILNISSDGTETVSAQLWYNNTNYTATKVGSNTEMTFTSEISHPWGEIANQTFYWTVQHGANLINTSSSGQDVQGIYLGVCNTTLTTPFINFTFKDEGTDTFINSTFEVYNWFYYVGDGSQNKTFDYVNTTEQESYAFCFNTNLTVHNNASIKYKSSTHPERTYTQNVDLTNDTTYVVLYLLSSADGQYVTFQVQDQYGTTINGVLVQIEKEFAGAWASLGQDLTDSSGSATFFLNPDDDHRITTTKTGYTSYTAIIRPTQSSYTIVMSSGAVVTTDFLWEGIKYNTYPKSGTILAPNTSYDFGFNVTGIIGNITACKLTITNSSFDEIGSATGCSAYGGNVTLNLGTGDNQKLFGNYYINFGSGYELLKSNDAWMIEIVNISSSGAYIWELMEKFVDYEEFGTGNKAEFNRITFFFILLVIGLGLFTKFTGVEMTNPGTTLMILWGIITLFSFVGLFAVEGIIKNVWLNKYAIWMMTSFLTWGFILNYWRRNAS